MTRDVDQALHTQAMMETINSRSVMEVKLSIIVYLCAAALTVFSVSFIKLKFLMKKEIIIHQAGNNQYGELVMTHAEIEHITIGQRITAKVAERPGENINAVVKDIIPKGKLYIVTVSMKSGDGRGVVNGAIGHVVIEIAGEGLLEKIRNTLFKPGL